MSTDEVRREPHSEDSALPASKPDAAAPGADHNPGNRQTQSLRILALAFGIPTLLILCVGAFLMHQNNSITGARMLEPDAIYAALHKMTPQHNADSLHAGDVDAMIRRLEASLEAHPNDVDGWRVLGWSHFRKQRYLSAAEAYGRAAELDTGNATLRSLQGEALVAAAKGEVSEAALKTFKTALELDKNDVRARFYSGQADLQNGNTKAALDTWIALLVSAPKGAEWSTDLRERVEEVAQQSGIDVSQSLPPLPSSKTTDTASAKPPRAGPTAQDVENASELSPQARETMARQMVDRLATRLDTSPKDADGWIMLIRSRMVLSEQAEAEAALKRALDVFATDPETKERIRLAAQALNVTAAK